MVTYTTNKGLGLPSVGGDAGAWGGPLNNNSSVLDASLGGVVTIAVSSVSGALTLLASDYNNIFLTFTGTLTQATTITLPSIGSFYVVQNLTGGSSVYPLTLVTAAAGQTIGAPPNDTSEIMTDGTNVKFRGLPPVGSYWDHCGSSVPWWVSACTVPPWLYCNGATFSSASYPALANYLGGNTLPDSRGRFRATLNDGQSRILSSVTGVNGNVILSSGGTTVLSSQNIPPVPYTDPGHVHGINGTAILGGGGAGLSLTSGSTAVYTNSQVTGITIGSTAPTGFVPPSYIGGLTFVRAG